MRMTRDSYAKEVRKVVEAMHQGEMLVTCPREDCDEQLRVLVASVRAGTTVVCAAHGVIFREEAMWKGGRTTSLPVDLCFNA